MKLFTFYFYVEIRESYSLWLLTSLVLSKIILVGHKLFINPYNSIGIDYLKDNYREMNNLGYRKSVIIFMV